MIAAYSFVFTVFAQKKFLKLDTAIQKRIHLKLLQLKDHPDIYSVLEQLVGLAHVTHRLRVGDYRVILRRVSQTKFSIFDVGHRRSIYE